MSGGAPEQTNSLKLPAYYRVKIKRGQWLYAPDSSYGSDYHTLKKRPSINSNSLLENIGANAVQPIVDDGRAKSIEVQVTENGRHATGLKCKIIDASGQVELVTFPGIGA